MFDYVTTASYLYMYHIRFQILGNYLFAISPISWLSLTWCFNIILVSAQLNFLRVDRVVSAAGGHCFTFNLPFFSSICIFLPSCYAVVCFALFLAGSVAKRYIPCAIRE